MNYDEDSAFELVRQIRLCDSLEDVADGIIQREQGLSTPPVPHQPETVAVDQTEADQFESELAKKMSELMLDGSMKFIGGTSNLLFLPEDFQSDDEGSVDYDRINIQQGSKFSIAQWTRVTDDEALVKHLINMYFTWHYAYFTTLSKSLFYRDFRRGQSSSHCSSLLVNAMLALGCHFTSWPGAFEHPEDSATAGDHFFKEAKRLLLEHDELERARLCTIQALALMSVREAGCGREGKGWVYSGMSFRMAYDLGLNFDSINHGPGKLNEEDVDARRITFWGCYLFDKWVESLLYHFFFGGASLTFSCQMLVQLSWSSAPIITCRCNSASLRRLPQRGSGAVDTIHRQWHRWGTSAACANSSSSAADLETL